MVMMWGGEGGGVNMGDEWDVYSGDWCGFGAKMETNVTADADW